MDSRWVLGAGSYLEQVFLAWKQARPGDAVQSILVPQTEDYSFDLSVLDALEPEQGQALVAFDERFGNFKREELFQAVQSRGFAMASFVSPSAAIADDALIGRNVFIGPHAVVGHGSRIGDGVVIHAGAHVGPNGRIGPFCWLESGVQLGGGVDIGSHGIVRMGAVLQAGIRIGRCCELGWPRLYREPVPDKTVFDARYSEPIYTYDFSNGF